jgi:predicted restriction endonuclease
MDLNQFLKIIRNMPMRGREFKPHRYLALMAIIDIIEHQENSQNKFYYNDTFTEYFSNYFQIYRGPNDQNRPFKPFFHLKNAGGFWFLRPISGNESELNRPGVGSERELDEIVEYAYLLPEIFDLLSNQESREIVRKEIKKCLIAGLQLRTRRTRSQV